MAPRSLPARGPGSLLAFQRGARGRARDEPVRRAREELRRPAPVAVGVGLAGRDLAPLLAALELALHLHGLAVAPAHLTPQPLARRVHDERGREVLQARLGLVVGEAQAGLPAAELVAGVARLVLPQVLREQLHPGVAPRIVVRALEPAVLL